MKKKTPVPITVYPPREAAQQEALEKLVALIHAAAVVEKIKSLGCSAGQKLQLLETVIETAKLQSREQTR